MNLEFQEIAKTLLAFFIVLSVQMGLAHFLVRREQVFSFWGSRYDALLAGGELVLLILALFRQNAGGEAATWYFCLWAYLFGLGIYDLKCRELPDYCHLLPLFGYGAAWLFGCQPVAGSSSLLAVVVAAAAFGLVYVIRKDAIGIGDIKVILVCAIYLGADGAGVLARGMAAAFVCSMILLLGRKVTAKSELPFVPFLLFGALFV